MRKRCPLRLRPRRRVILVLTYVSSKNTNRYGCWRMRGWRWACQTRRSSRTSARAHSAAIRCFFISEAALAQETREHRGSRDDPMFLEQPDSQFRHGDGGPSLDGLDQERLIRRQLAASRRTALTVWCRRAEVARSLDELDGETVTDTKVPGRRPAGMAGLDKSRDPHPKIEGIAVTHDPPPVQESESQPRLVQKPRSPIASPML